MTSQGGDFSSSSASFSSYGNNSDSGVPVNASNPYVLKCINSSDGYIVSQALKDSVIPKRTKLISGKVSSVDWNQDEDLIVTLDNACLIHENYTDTMLQYVDVKNIKPNMPLTVYIIKKESVTNLEVFIKNALLSQCLLATEKNREVKLKTNALDPSFSLQKHLLTIGATESFLNSTLSYNSGQLYKTRIAIIDSGLDLNNPDIIPQIARDENNNVLGYNSTEEMSALSDSGFHGTHVAGLAAAGYRNGKSGSGVWGRNVEIMPIRATNNGDTLRISDVANGIIWATTRNADLINLSLGSEGDSTVLKNAISFAISNNVVVVVAAGNDGKQLGTELNQYPAMYTTQFQGLISVGSTDLVTNNLSTFSNFSSSYVDILAPGSNGGAGIYSTIPMSLSSDGFGFSNKIPVSGGTSIIHGTSMSTPIVTGALAAVISMARGRGIVFTNVELEKMILGEGSPKNSAYSAFAFRGNYLNFQSLIKNAKIKIEEAVKEKIAGQNLAVSSQPVNKQAVLSEKVELSVGVSNAPSNIIYQWFRNNVKVDGANKSTLIFEQINENDAGSYHVEITSGSNKAISQKVSVKVALKYCN
ncbi:MAG: S8 family serine peptidase [Pseudobdellovibrio sp.]